MYTVISIVLGILCMLSSGYVISNGWDMFMVPLGVPPISFWHAVGLLSFVGSFFTGLYVLVSYESSRDAKPWDSPARLTVLLIMNWLSYGLMLFYHWMM